MDSSFKFLLKKIIIIKEEEESSTGRLLFVPGHFRNKSPLELKQCFEEACTYKVVGYKPVSLASWTGKVKF